MRGSAVKARRDSPRRDYSSRQASRRPQGMLGDVVLGRPCAGLRGEPRWGTGAAGWRGPGCRGTLHTHKGAANTFILNRK